MNHIDASLIHQFPGDVITYRSIDSTISDDEAVHFPTEFLNSRRTLRSSTTRADTQKGLPIILLRSLNPPRLMNGMRCIMKKGTANLIEAKISLGSFTGEVVVIPRIPLIPSDSELPFQFRRVQFPVRPCFAMTINKSQGQTLKEVGIDLSTPSFSHGMLYVAQSQTGSHNSVVVNAPGRVLEMFTVRFCYQCYTYPLCTYCSFSQPFVTMSSQLGNTDVAVPLEERRRGSTVAYAMLC